MVECKVLRGGLEAAIREGVEQTLAYMDRCRGESGHLVIFDRDESKPWEEKLYRREESLDGRPGDRVGSVNGRLAFSLDLVRQGSLPVNREDVIAE